MTFNTIYEKILFLNEFSEAVNAIFEEFSEEGYFMYYHGRLKYQKHVFLFEIFSKLKEREDYGKRLSQFFFHGYDTIEKKISLFSMDVHIDPSSRSIPR